MPEITIEQRIARLETDVIAIEGVLYNLRESLVGTQVEAAIDKSYLDAIDNWIAKFNLVKVQR